jgi:PKD repeat protein
MGGDVSQRVLIVILLITIITPLYADTHYVNVSNATPVAPYASWATAATLIQDAVNMAKAGDTVLVTNGVYETGGRAVYGTMTNRVVVTRGLTVRSVNGPGVTVIRGMGPRGARAIRCVYVGNNAILSGFTLTDGATRLSGDQDTERSGGGAWCAHWSVIRNCTLSGNSAEHGGGAFLEGYGRSNEGALFNCTLTGNSAYWGGGSCNGRLFNCTLSGSSAHSGGGAVGGILENCTISGNRASVGGGAFRSTLNNCVLYYNTARFGPNWYEGSLSHCCTTPRPDGIGNITNVPLIASASNPHLLAGSPCIDAGSNTYAVGSDTDGQFRITNGTVDIGCDEYTPPCTGALEVAILATSTSGVAVGYAIPFEAVVTGTPHSLVWQWGDGSRTTNNTLTSHAYASPGIHEVVLTANNASGSISCAMPVLVEAAATRYVRVAGGHAPPFTSWANAATTIQAAVDAALPGDTVLVSNGAYATGGRVVHGATTNRIAITKPITVRSLNGPAVTFIRGTRHPRTTNGDSAVRCAYITNGAVLAGFTLTNGATRSSGTYAYQDENGGGAWCEPGGTLSNCILSGNSANTAGGGTYLGTLNSCTLSGNWAESGGGAYRCTMTDCTLTGNSASYDGGGARDCTLSNCTLLRNWAENGGGAYRCAMTDCTLSGNSAGQRGRAGDVALNNPAPLPRMIGDGGGAYWSTLINCKVSENTAYRGGGAYRGTLNNCSLMSNSAEKDGGGSCGSDLKNCMLAGNSARFGGGVYGGTLVNCTITGNSADRVGGGVAKGKMCNCIIFYNTAVLGANYLGGEPRYCDLYYCCTTPLAEGEGNIAVAPLLASVSHLGARSPCIGAGSSTYAEGTDIDGDAWNVPPAMGCDDVLPGSVTGALAVAIRETDATIAVGFAARFAACVQGRVTGSVWDFGDGTSISNGPYAVHAFARSGTYPVVLTGFNSSFPRGVSNTVTVDVVSRPIHYVDAANVSPLAPYASWKTAARSIQDAVDAVQVPGALVLVTNGVYDTGGRVVPWQSLTNRVVINKPVTVRSVNGPDVTIIKGRGQIRPPVVPMVDDEKDTMEGPEDHCVVRCAHIGDGASLHGFTLTSASSTSGGMLSHCILSGKSTASAGLSFDSNVSNCAVTATFRSPLSFSRFSLAPTGVLSATMMEVVPESIHFVNAASASPLAPYKSWQTAARSIQDAVDAVQVPGALVLVTNGVYDTGGRTVPGQSPANRVMINMPMTVRSINGPKVTFVKGRGPKGHSAVRSVYAGDGAVIDGFTLVNGHSDTNREELLRDVRIEECGGGILCAATALATNCVISGSQASWGGGAAGGTLNNCTIEGNSAEDGGAAYGCVLNNCTIIRNRADLREVVAETTLSNCRVTGAIRSASDVMMTGWRINPFR